MKHMLESLYSDHRSMVVALDAMQHLVRRHTPQTAAADAVLDELARRHAGSEAEWPPFAAARDVFLRQYDTHMRLEEDVVMPIANRVIERPAWEAIEADFATRTDPLASVHGDELMPHVLRMPPAPLGHADP